MVGLALLLVAGLVGGIVLLRSGGDDEPAASESSRSSDADSDDRAEATTSDDETASEELDEQADPLGLGREMVNQDCNGDYLVMLASTGKPKEYVPLLERALDAAPTARYLVTNESCSSFNQDYEGNPIYAAYTGPFDLDTACEQRQVLAYRGAYVRQLDAGVDRRTSCGCAVGISQPVISRTIGESSVTASFAVEDLQILLAEAGYNPEREIDGIFGPVTDGWVRDFQRDEGLEVNGIVDYEVWDRLAGYCP
jgi:hypothetical protein